MWFHPVLFGILVLVHHSGIHRHLNNLPLKYLIDCLQLSECWHFEAFKVFRTIQSCKFWVKIYNAMKTKLSVPTFRFSTKRTIRPLKWGKWVFWIPFRWVHFNMSHKNSGVRTRTVISDGFDPDFNLLQKPKTLNFVWNVSLLEVPFYYTKLFYECMIRKCNISIPIICNYVTVLIKTKE